MGQVGKHWNESDIDTRKNLLSMYFSSPVTINKHAGKNWNALPMGFKAYLNRLAAKTLFD